MKKGLKILGLEVDRIRRLNIVRIQVDPATNRPIFVVGKNEQGKSTALDSFVWALSGGRLPDEMIRRGEEGGEIRIALGDDNGPAMTVRKVFKTGQDPRLIVKTVDGMVGNQKTLATIVGAIGLDPVALANMSGADQAAAVQTALGLSFADLEAERARVYQERADLNRRIRDDEALARAFQIPDGTPDALVDVAALSRDLENVRDMIQANDQARRDLATARGRLEQDREMLPEFTEKLTEIDNRIGELKRQIMKLEESKVQIVADQDALSVELEERESELTLRDAEVAALVDPDPEPIRVQIQEANAVNEAVRAKTSKADLEKRIAKAKEDAETKTARLEAVEQTKKDRVAAAGLPPGLEQIGFDPERGLTFEGFALKDLSTATRLRVATQIVLLLNQKRTGRPLNVILIKAGNDLDEDNRRTIIETAAEVGAQVWMELVRKPDGDEGLVVEVADGEAFFGVDPDAQKAEEAKKPQEQVQAPAPAPKPAALDNELAAAQARLEAKRKARAAKNGLAPDVQGVVKQAMVAAGRGSELFN